MRKVGAVRGCELLVEVERSSEVYYLRIPEEHFNYCTTRRFRRMRLGEYRSFFEAEQAAREVLNGGRHQVALLSSIEQG